MPLKIGFLVLGVLTDREHNTDRTEENECKEQRL
uniref:Uncharacterized protein n=1 Tax=Myoviridae sp. ctCdG12 TaxID=2825052 RepID=A0A8S5U2P2_9CAUD|nr:MAG TPA: hypothetical protein [Myoviridae sp. ctCdG12]DAY38628.1 MAG TPA: hypothetical protein [Caudoviricetes sp.]